MKATIDADTGVFTSSPAPNGRNANPRAPDFSRIRGSIGANRANRPKNMPKTSPCLIQLSLPNTAMPPQVSSEYASASQAILAGTAGLGNTSSVQATASSSPTAGHTPRALG